MINTDKNSFHYSDEKKSMIPIFHGKGLVIKHTVIDAQRVHAVWSYKEQIQSPSTGCS